MYPILSPGSDQLTDKEKQMARLLYSIPSGTAPLDSVPVAALDSGAVDEDGLITVVIPTYAGASL